MVLHWTRNTAARSSPGLEAEWLCEYGDYHIKQTGIVAGDVFTYFIPISFCQNSYIT
jgi:hypothetical protein